MLRAEGLKLTPQRLAVIDILFRERFHGSAEDIHRKIKKRFPSMSLATVYNTLHTLQRIGIVREFRISDANLFFELLTDPHHHLVCRRCDRIIDIPISLVPQPADVSPHRMESFMVIFYGACSKCLEKAKALTKQN